MTGETCGNRSCALKKVCYNIKIKGHKSSFYIGVWKNIFEHFSVYIGDDGARHAQRKLPEFDDLRRGGGNFYCGRHDRQCARNLKKIIQKP